VSSCFAAEFDRKDRMAPVRSPAQDARMARASAAASLPSGSRVDERRAWRAVTARDRAYDGAFVFAVRTTGIFCRPSCPARRPRRENVLFFSTSDDAAKNGFRPCKRCRPRAPRGPAETLVVRARALLDRAMASGDLGGTTLDALARELDVSPFHLQRSFKRAHGVSPRAYVDAARAARFASAARSGKRVLDAAHDAGYGSSRAVYEGATRALGMTPKALRENGEGERVAYTLARTPWGRMLVAASARGVVRVALGDRDDDLVRDLERDLSRATLLRDDLGLRALVRRVVRAAEGASGDVPLDLRGTALQLRVWDALRKVPRGTTTTYGELARAVGAPRAVRAVARACGANPVALVVPCHRVVAKDGALTGYRWGLARKRKLLEAEAER
jgi:AraC family transcriptional regulator of adaptative response/methylated-DNA-[protein]-cysteine methyltransferase